MSTNPGIFNADTKLVLQGAALLIAASGVCLVVQQHALARRLFLAGAALAVASGLISANSGSTAADRIAELAALLVAAGLCAVLIFKARRCATYLIAAGVVGWVIASIFKTTVNWLFGHWWIVPIAFLFPFAAALIAKAWTRGMRDRAQRAPRPNSGSHFLSLLFEFLCGARRGSRRRNRHIGDIGMTKRSRRGAGPNMI